MTLAHLISERRAHPPSPCGQRTHQGGQRLGQLPTAIGHLVRHRTQARAAD